MKKTSVFKGTFIGLAIGAVAGVLLAPKSGKETQEDIKRRARGLAGDARTRLETMSDEVSGRVNTLKDAARDLKGEAREESQELIRRAEVLGQDMRSAANNLTTSGATAKDAMTSNARRLLDEGADVMRELERVTRQLMGSAKEKVNREKLDQGVAGKRQERVVEDRVQEQLDVAAEEVDRKRREQGEE